MSELPYYRLPDPPDKMSAVGLTIRLVDSFGFRYRWATEGLREEDLGFKACDSSMSLDRLLGHIHGLISVTEAFLVDTEREKIDKESLADRRQKTLEIAWRLRERLSVVDDEYLENRSYRVPWAEKEYPVWYLINGPLSDALTHVGQIASWRRINGNPIPGARVFYGTPPEEA